MPTGFTTVSASYLQNASGTPISNATISFQPVANNGVPLSFRSGGAEGQTVTQAVTAQVTNGAFTIQLADTSLTSPVNVGYRVTVTDNVSGKSLLGIGYGCIQPTGATWSLDSFVPNVAAQVTVQNGPSAYEVAVSQGYVGTATQWLASLKGATGEVSAEELATALSPGIPDGTPYTIGANSTINNTTATPNVASVGPNYAQADGLITSVAITFAPVSAPGTIDLLILDVTPGSNSQFTVADRFTVNVPVSSANQLVTFRNGSDFSNKRIKATQHIGYFTNGGALPVYGGDEPGGLFYFIGDPGTGDNNYSIFFGIGLDLSATVTPGEPKGALYDAFTSGITKAIAAIPPSSSGSGSAAIDNVFDLTTVELNGFIKWQNSAGFQSNNGYNSTGFISVVPGQTYTTSQATYGSPGSGNGIAYYDANQAPIGTGDETAYNAWDHFTVPGGVYFIRMTFHSTYATPDTILENLMILKGVVSRFLPDGVTPQPYIPYSGAAPYTNTVIDNKIAAATTFVGQGLSTSEATLGNQAVTLTQLRSRIASRSDAPSIAVSCTGKSWGAFGDSITAGYALQDPSTETYMAWANYKLGAQLTNHGVSGDEACDLTHHVFDTVNTTATNAPLFSVQIGTNDMNLHDVGAHEATFALALNAALSWLGTRAQDRVDAGTVTAANWSPCTDYASVTGAQSTTNGASITYHLTTYGNPLYVWSVMQDGDSGSFTVAIDGGAPMGVGCYPPSTIQTQNGSNRGVQLTRIPLPAGAHTIAITHIGPDNFPVRILSLGTASPHTYYTSPTVVVGGVLPVQGDAKQAATAQYTMDVLDSVELLQGDGLDIRYADNRAALKDGEGDLYIGAGNLHPNGVGHQQLSFPYIHAFQRTPLASVNRGTPLTSAGPGTPGESWAYGGYVYGVQADGTLQRTATATF